MKKTLLLFLTILATHVQALFIKERAIEVSIGAGLSAPYDEVDITGSGFYAQGEYVIHLLFMG